jgi:hypothetical protein
VTLGNAKSTEDAAYRGVKVFQRYISHTQILPLPG